MSETPEAEPTRRTAEATTASARSPTRSGPTSDPISEAVAPGYRFEGDALELGGLMLERRRPQRRTHPDPAGDAQPPRPRRRRHRHRQDEDPAAARRAAQRQRRARLRRRHQGRPVRHQRAGRAERQAHRAHRQRRPGVDGDRLPDGVLRDRRPGRRRTRPRDDERVRPDPARQGARPERDAGVLAGPGLLLLRQAGAAAARPRRPARGPAVPHRRRGREGRAQDDRRALAPDRRRDPARAGRLRGPGRRRVLRRAGVRDQGVPAHRRGRTRHHQPARAAQPPGPAGALLDLPDVAARRPLPRPAGGGRPRQAQAGLLLRRGAPALQRRLRRLPRPDRPDRAADPVQGRRRLLRDAVAHRRPRRRARPARLARSSTSSAPTPPTTPRPSRRPSTPTPTARTTTSARSSRRSGSARRS